MDISGGVVVVTGGARGIGAAIAEELGRRGAHVVIGDVDTDLARRTASRCGARVAELDVTDPQAWTSLVAEVGRIDVLVNNAGLMPVGRFVEEADALTGRQLDVNVLGVILGARAVLPGMLERGRGVVVNVASQAGKLGVGGLATYHATKFAVVGLSQALDDELYGTGVGVSCVLPGLVDTELSAGLPSTWMAPRVAPDRVARVVAAAIERPGGERWVPRRGRVTFGAGGMLPVGARRRLLRAIGHVDPVLGAIDDPQRRGYEQRISGARPDVPV